MADQPCAHGELLDYGNVFRHMPSGQLVVELRIHCAQCHAPFRFVGQPTVTVDGTMLRAAIAPGSENPPPARVS